MSNVATIRETIIERLVELFEDEDLTPPEFTDEMVLLESDLDSLAYAVLVTVLEEELGYDPFSLMSEPEYPTTFGELVAVYERFADHRQ